MSENETQGNEQNSTEEPSGLRKQYEETLAELKALKQERRQRAYKDAGIPEGAHELFDKTYDGELTVDALREFGEAKGFRLSDLGNKGGNAPTPEAQQAQQDGQSRLDAVDAARLPSDEPSVDTKIAEAQANGDWMASFQLKSELLDQARKNRPQPAA